ncbi:MAG: hypothetical protein LBK53_03575 [Heliobacteriaceae bacterium]|jgi:hypothetical protein|nr:hypothetical protein [Heliobacteriaceae bacterium]
MPDRFKNLKIVKTLRNAASPQLRWLTYAGKSPDKLSPEYVRLISGVEELQSSAEERKLEAMVRAQLKEEFPNIESMKSYEKLVDAVMLNIKKKQIEAFE